MSLHINRLNRAEQRWLEDFVLAAWSQIEEKCLLPAVIASMASEQYGDGRVFTGANVRSSAAALNKQWPKPAKVKSVKRNTTSGQRRVRRHFVLHDRLLLRTVDILVHLCEELEIRSGDQFSVAELKNAATEFAESVSKNHGMRSEAELAALRQSASESSPAPELYVVTKEA